MRSTTWSWELEMAPVAAREARGLVQSVLVERGLGGEFVEDATLLASEVVTNAVVHGSAPVILSLIQSGPRWQLRVHDGTRAGPQVGDLDRLAEQERGMHIVDVMAARWGVDRLARNGKDVWVDLR